MATYYPTSSPQIDQKFVSYSDSPVLHGNIMMYLNPSSSTGSFPEIPPGSSINPQQNSVGIASLDTRNHEMMFIPPMNAALNVGTEQTVGNSSIPGDLQLNPGNQVRIGENDQNLQGLSLSLNTQMSSAVSTASFQFQYSNPGLSSVLSPHLPMSAENTVRPMASSKVDEASPSRDMGNSDFYSYDMHGDGNNNIRFGGPNNQQYVMNMKAMNCSNPYQYEQAGISSTILKPQYLRAAQQLLDEVVNVRDALKRSEPEKDKNMNKVDEGSKESKVRSQSGSETKYSAAGPGSTHELSPAEKQDLQSKLDKLHSMLDEVDRRYKQYCHQMQILVSSFDVVTGSGAAKPYITLALKTISRHFRCLRDAITGQIQATQKSLGEQDSSLAAIPRLRYVDQQLRQQRALQQFGMMRHAWRPQRGLPESAVTILRAWLFEHFLHPYPKDSEKILLARQTGLTRSQVANWFINARVRLWKPMVEEMYKEEFGDADMNSRSSPENTPKFRTDKFMGSENRKEDMQESMTFMAHESSESKSIVNLGVETKGPSSSTTPTQYIDAFRSNNDQHGFYTNGTIPSDSNPEPPHLMVSSAAYHISELGNFSMDNNQVSLALGLRHHESDVVPLSSEATFPDNGTTEGTMGVVTAEYPYLEQVNQQHRFSNPHILNDFVA